MVLYLFKKVFLYSQQKILRNRYIFFLDCKIIFTIHHIQGLIIAYTLHVEIWEPKTTWFIKNWHYNIFLSTDRVSFQIHYSLVTI